MKNLWVDRDNDVDPVKAQANLIEAAYFDARDAKIKDRLNFALGKGLKIGVYICSQGEGWQPLGDGSSWADYASKLLATADLGEPDKPMVCLNCEQHVSSTLLAMFKRWRAHRQKRVTAWSMEGHQAVTFPNGWLTSELVAYCVANGIDAWPQAYGDTPAPMTRTESDRVALEMVKAGFPADRIWCVYKAADLGYWFDGTVFSQGTLP